MRSMKKAPPLAVTVTRQKQPGRVTQTQAAGFGEARLSRDGCGRRAP